MIKQTAAVALTLLLSGCSIDTRYNNGLTMIDQGKIMARGMVCSNGDEFTLPIHRSPKVDCEKRGDGVYFTIINGVLERTYVVSGEADEIKSLSDNLAKAKRVTFEFLPSGEYMGLSKNKFYYSDAIPRKNCQFTLENCER